MEANSIEERLKKLEEMNKNLEEKEKQRDERDKKLQHEFERLQAVHEIQNLMGTYVYSHTGHMRDKQAELFAKKTPGVTAEIANSGIYDGYEGAVRLWPGRHALGDKAIGHMVCHPVCAPLIEVAADGKTAKALWSTTGMEVGARGPKGEIFPRDTWIRYAIDCVKEDGHWKFWHFHIFVLFCCNWGDPWSKVMQKFPIPDVPDKFKPDRPPTSDPKISSTDLLYRLDGTFLNRPPIPEPYETWDDSMSYTG